MDKQEAYNIVYDDLINLAMFNGEYDAKNGNEHFMYGIATVVEYIAHIANQEDNFNEIFYRNMRKSMENKC